MRRIKKGIIYWLIFGGIVGYLINLLLLTWYLYGLEWFVGPEREDLLSNLVICAALTSIELIIGTPIVAVVGNIVVERRDGKIVTNRSLWGSDSLATRYGKVYNWRSQKDENRKGHFKMFLLLSTCVLAFLILFIFTGADLCLKVSLMLLIMWIGGYIINIKGFEDVETSLVPLHLILGIQKKELKKMRTEEIRARLEGLTLLIYGAFKEAGASHSLRISPPERSGVFARYWLKGEKLLVSFELSSNPMAFEIEIRNAYEKHADLIIEIMSRYESYLKDRGIKVE